MKKILAVMVTGIGLLYGILILTSCAHYWTKEIVENLQPAELYKWFKTESTNLKALSKCPVPPTIKIVNAETRDEDILFFSKGVNKFYLNPKGFMNGAIDYLRDSFERCSITVEDNSPKVIKVSMQDIRVIPGVWAPGTNLRVKVYIPETNYLKSYVAEQYSYDIGHSSADVVHFITQEIINDPVIQDYILCK